MAQQELEGLKKKTVPPRNKETESKSNEENDKVRNMILEPNTQDNSHPEHAQNSKQTEPPHGASSQGRKRTSEEELGEQPSKRLRTEEKEKNHAYKFPIPANKKAYACIEEEKGQKYMTVFVAT